MNENDASTTAIGEEDNSSTDSASEQITENTNSNLSNAMVVGNGEFEDNDGEVDSDDTGDHPGVSNGSVNDPPTHDEEGEESYSSNDIFTSAHVENGYYSNGDPSDTSSVESSEADSNGDTQEEEEEEEDYSPRGEILPAARQHTYLPGTTNPLFPEQWLQPNLGLATTTMHSTVHQHSMRHATLLGNNNNNNALILPILQLHEIVLFPNSTLPLRLTRNSWVRYLSRQISHARDGGIGRRTRNNVDNEADSGGYASQETSQHNAQVQIGIVTKLKNTRRRRRTHHNRHTSTQNSAQGESDRINQDLATNLRSGRMGRWNMELIRRGILRRRQNDENDDIDHSGSNEDESSLGQRRVSQRERYLHPLDSSEENVSDPLLHRIGTLATITYTHEDDQRSDENVRRIIVTALSTGRFRIVRRVSQENDSEIDDSDECRMYHVQEIFDDLIHVPHQVLKQTKPNISSIKTANESAKREKELGAKQEESSYSNLNHKLSLVSPIPAFVYRKYLPWNLTQDIVKIIESNKTFHGLSTNLPLSSGKYHQKITSIDNSEQNDNMVGCHKKSYCDPVSFSFWLATNLPLPIMNKLDILEMNCVERLLYLLEKIKEKSESSCIKCKNCGSKLAKMKDLFTVPGAEGTSGAYVNEHGCIHQTTTVETVFNENVFCYGGEETKDSWFPGYSWTIACCSTCAAHLGWHFKFVAGGASSINKGPHAFWGLSESSITTEQVSTPRRLSLIFLGEV